MNKDAFEWDARKAAENYAKHRVRFEAACEVFSDPFALEWLDESEHYDEDRFLVLGMAEGRLVALAFTMRGEPIRIISARLAEAHERKRYHEENQT